jgi:nucleoside-diphosphate-sugar epimerase
MVWDYYDGKVLFVTGGSGFIGTALLWRLLSQSSPERVYVLCRGGYA